MGTRSHTGGNSGYHLVKLKNPPPLAVVVDFVHHAFRVEACVHYRVISIGGLSTVIIIGIVATVIAVSGQFQEVASREREEEYRQHGDCFYCFE
jgi:hypothetical protein